MSILVIAEKPSVARDIGKVLGATKKGQGFIYGNDYIVSWAVGHLVTLYEPDDYDKSLKKWDFKTLPIIPEEIKLKPSESVKDQYLVLKSLIENDKVSELICATDSGREGELIFRYIYDLVGTNKPFKRLWISSMTNTAIKEGFENLKDGHEYDNLYYSAKCRSHADWLVGINATRSYTIEYNTLLSIGRVQTPTLAIIVNRQKEIDSFVPEDYYEIKADFNQYKGTYVDVKMQTKIESEDRAKEILADVKNKDGIVKSIKTEEKSVATPLLFDLTELQRVCNRKFGLSAKKTLDIAQDLYEKKKYITYPRTDSRYLSDDMIPTLKGVIQKLSIPEYETYTKYLLDLPKLPITKRIVDNSKITDHHAIIPTSVNFNLNTLSKDERNVFDVIARRFMSVFYPKYEYASTTLITTIDKHDFQSTGTTILKLGFKEVNNDDFGKKDDTQILPDVKEGDVIPVSSVKKENKKTKPKKLYNEATLLTEMENAGKFVEDEELKETLKESGIGTPATRAQIIERLITVGYIKRQKKFVVPTKKAITLIDILPKQLTSAETTGKWEKGLSKISRGEMNPDDFMNSINRFVNYLVNNAKNEKKDVYFEPDKKYQPKSNQKTFGKCPKCNDGLILENSKGYYCTNWKSGCKFTIWKDTISRNKIDVPLTDDMVSRLILDKKIEIPFTQNDISKMLVLEINEDGNLTSVMNTV